MSESEVGTTTYRSLAATASPADGEPRPVEFPVPCKAFIATLKGPDLVWGKLLTMAYGREKHTEAQWRALIARHAVEPGYQANRPRRLR